jgi:DNA-binding NtrC family response regulator
VGVFEHANGGTLFLDEVGELPLALQPKLLRAVEYGEVQRVGSLDARKADVCVIAATNRDLRVESAAGRFRSDLFYRLSIIEIHLPPLRERREDIPYLTAGFVREIAARLERQVTGVTPAAERLLQQAAWPGNIRELRNVIERATILADSEFIEPKHLPPTLITRGEESLPTMTISPGTTVDEAERRLILLTLDHTRNNKTRAAEILGISLKTLHNKLNRMKDETGARS